jgi:C2 domain
MRRRTRSVDRKDQKSSGYFGRRTKSVERPTPKHHNALMHDDDDSYTGSRKHQSGVSTRSALSNDHLSGDDDSFYSKKSSGGSSWFGGGSSAPSLKSKGKKGWREEEIASNEAHDRAYRQPLASVNDIEKLAQKRGQNLLDERFRVLPDEAYPNTYLNRGELRHEMSQKSVYFHDTRVRTDKAREVGQLRVEILQCFGLPATSLVREVSAYCIAVCGSHAFKTDIMPPVANPMWLCKMRRACLFPVLHAYARLFVGVFDNSSENANDFIGRVVVDVARLRPGCCYDFTLPLRQSSNVFVREQHGAVRLRLHLMWHTERDAIMSYIPRTKPEFRPQEKVNVACLDEQSFRNVAHTVHGVHMPGKFSAILLKATVREANFARIHVMRYVRKREIYHLVYWQYPLISGFVFVAW